MAPSWEMIIAELMGAILGLLAGVLLVIWRR